MRDCPKCSGFTRVKDTIHDETGVYRRRTCTECGHQFYTVEAACENPPVRHRPKYKDRAVIKAKRQEQHADYREAAKRAGMNLHRFRLARMLTRQRAEALGVEPIELFRKDNILTLKERERLNL